MHRVRAAPIGRRIVGTTRPAIGVFVLETATPGLWPVLEAASLDFGVVDMEHGAFSYRDVSVVLAGARATETAAFVRVPELTRSAVGRVLDLGADGVIAPRVGTVDEAAAFVAAARYAPAGSRNAAFGLAHDGYARGVPADTAGAANEGIACIALVETTAGVDAIEDIVAVDGIDAVWIGPTDLSQSLGLLGDLDNPAYVEAEERVVEVCRRNRVPLGLVVRNASDGAAAVERGFTLIALGTEISLLQGAASSLAAAIRERATPATRGEKR